MTPLIFLDYAPRVDLLHISLESCSSPSGGWSLEMWEQDKLWDVILESPQDVILEELCCSTALQDGVHNEPPQIPSISTVWIQDARVVERMVIYCQ